MGIYLNPGDDAFKEAACSQIYVDKTLLLAYTNQIIKTSDKYICVSRPRRFGKSMAANMVAAYYDRTANADDIFRDLLIAKDDSFAKHSNQYDVIHINMQDFLSRAQDMDNLLQALEKSILWELLEEYPNYPYFDKTDLARTMADVYRHTKRAFVVVIDEWDCVFREYGDQKDWQEQYLDFLRTWLKDKSYIGLAYMTGILPIKKYGTHSALNMFEEFSMTNAGPLASYVGFTEQEVKTLCAEYQMNFDECKIWYDGYYFEEVGSIYNPRSVVQSMKFKKYDTYWNRTETFEALKIYIDMNYEGLRESIIALMAGGSQKINTGNFVNDMTTFQDKDDVLTLLVHLGYLSYDFIAGAVSIPNQEIMQEYANATRNGDWNEIAGAISRSELLLQATLDGDEKSVAKGIAEAHLETSHLQYNDENALSYTISLAYYAARQKYIVVRELPTGKGFAGLVFLPRLKYAALPVLIVELKWNASAQTALSQIKAKKYPQAVEDYTGKLLLVGINYDKETKNHTCKIEEWTK